MEVERRGRPDQRQGQDQPPCGRSLGPGAKSFSISKRLVYEAYKRVKANKGRSGVDKQSLKDFDEDLSNNLYKLWNRLSSGSYLPPAVLRVDIPKGDGGTRPLGIPTVADRIAQMVVKLQIEPELEQRFHSDSYGYRPKRSAKDALWRVQERVIKRPWVLDMDIKGFFDSIDHDLLMRAVRRHVKEPWQVLYIERWLKAPVQYEDGRQESRERGTPQGGVISPLLANLYLHYAFDCWVSTKIYGVQFVRYADDIVCQCTSESQARWLWKKVEERFAGCGLTLHPEKTKVVYCRGDYNQGRYEQTSFDFLGYTFRPRRWRRKSGEYGTYFYGAVSRKSAKAIRSEINQWPWKYWVQKEIGEIRRYARSRLRGWLHYYGAFGWSEIKNVLFHVDCRLSRWAFKKYKRLKTLMQAAHRLNRARHKNPYWFAHWACN